ncbi:MAG: hypothetical protein IPK60_24970 [Sandaracinaceae bacterium]|nr:hypothetical protein [Sandaracinaceae bacterium]
MKCLLVAAAMCMAATVACNRVSTADREQPRGRGFVSNDPAEAQPSATTTARTSPDHRRGRTEAATAFERPAGRDDYRAPAVRVDEPERTATETTSTPAPQPSRDLSAELRALAGSSAACANGVDLSHALSHMRISVEATVTTSGVVTRSSVSGNGVPSAITACMNRGLQNARFTAAVPDAPRTVRAVIELDRVAVAPAPTAPAPLPSVTPTPPTTR